jgi:seryl-tRNA(Sec) selenium transferase
MFKYKSKTLEELGVKSRINASNWSTSLGGCWIPDIVLEAMNEVSKTFVDMHELIEKSDQTIANMLSKDEAHIVTGAGAGIELAVAGCMTENNEKFWKCLPDTREMKNEILMHRGHYTSYSSQWTASGGRIIEFGQGGQLTFNGKEFESLISNKTCCISYTVSFLTTARGCLPLERLIEVGKENNIPIIVDAAGMLPPSSNLHKYLDMGADIVSFSGGKAIQAPNNTGFILGIGRGAEISKSIR